MGQTSVLFGVEQVLAGRPESLAGRRVGLVTNDAATTAARPGPLIPARQALQQAGVYLVRLFSPEHGLAVAAADGHQVEDAVDPLTGLPVSSLYGATFRPTAVMLEGLDLLLFDIPDVGVRFYTYIWTLSHVMEACAEAGLPLWVLDRPNPLGGDLGDAEGPMLDEEHISTFVGRWSMPVRHCLTAGELARLWNQERSLGVDLTVVPVTGWRRAERWSQTGLPFVPTSPNIPDFETVLVYPGTCLCEGANVSEGRGTTTPFRVAGAPWLDGIELARAFNALALPGIVARPVQFTPIAAKYRDELCHGVMVHAVPTTARFRPVAAGLHLLALIASLSAGSFRWLPYPTAANAPGYGHFDSLIGQLSVREQLSQGLSDPVDAIAAWTRAPGWKERAQPHLLYA